jgi:hypothetical protein
MTRKGELTARISTTTGPIMSLSRQIRSAKPQEQRGRALLCGCPVGGAADVLPARSDLDFVVFCFAKPEDADAFSERFAGERLSGDARRSP